MKLMNVHYIQMYYLVWSKILQDSALISNWLLPQLLWMQKNSVIFSMRPQFFEFQVNDNPFWFHEFCDIPKNILISRVFFSSFRKKISGTHILHESTGSRLYWCLCCNNFTNSCYTTSWRYFSFFDWTRRNWNLSRNFDGKNTKTWIKN